jgi:hypothetical protein
LAWQLCRSVRAGTLAAALSLADARDYGNCGLGRRDGCARYGRTFASLVADPAGDLDRYDTRFDRRMGVRESAMVLAFSYAGLAESDGLIISILLGATTFPVGAFRWHYLDDQ